MVVTDEDGVPLRRAMVWLDRCRAEGLPRIGGKWGLAFKAARVTETVATFMAEAEANLIRTPGARDLGAHRAVPADLSGFLVHRLTGRVRGLGRVAGRATSRSTTRPCAGRSRATGSGRRRASIRAWLPELVPPGGLLGTISAAASEATGIPAGLPLIAAAGDKACEVLGSGALEPHIGAISLGTTASINTTHRRYVEVVPIVPPYPAAVPGAYSLEVQSTAATG